MKQKLSLLEVCKLPDLQLHSKQALFKSIVSKESTEVVDMKQQIIKLSYTVKTVGIQGNEVGISSRRVPLKFKKKQEYPKPNFVAPNNFLPHKLFYSQPLATARKEKQKSREEKLQSILFMSNGNTVHIEDDAAFETQKFKVRTKSMVNMRIKGHQVNQQQNLQNFGRVKGIKKVESAPKKKSFSNLLKQCKGGRDNELINPLMHQENPLFKRIQRIKMVYPELCQQAKSASCFKRFKIPSKYSSASSNFLKQQEDNL